MREIKFRAYDGMDWVYSSAVEYRKEDDQWLIYDFELEEWMYCSKPEQFTGLKDKNGVEIYEGDIVKLMMPDRSYTIQGNGYIDVGCDEGFESVGEVKFLHSMWFIDEDAGRGCPLDFDSDQMLEVIGNRFENPELLENQSTY